MHHTQCEQKCCTSMNRKLILYLLALYSSLFFCLTGYGQICMTGSIGVSGDGCGCLSGCDLTSFGGPDCGGGVTGNCDLGYLFMSQDINVPAGCEITVIAVMETRPGCSASGADGSCSTCDRLKVDIPGGTKGFVTGGSNASISDSYTLTGPGTIRISGFANRADEIITYSVDANGSCPCSSLCNGLTLATDSTEVSCFGGNDGTATVTVSGGTTPYTYLWDDPLFQTTATATGLSAGTYIVTVTDDGGCTVTDTVIVTEPPLLVATTSGSIAPCPCPCSGSAYLFPTGGTSPYTIIWSNGYTDQFQTGLCDGTYTVTLTDANGCTATGSVTLP